MTVQVDVDVQRCHVVIKIQTYGGNIVCVDTISLLFTHLQWWRQVISRQKILDL